MVVIALIAFAAGTARAETYIEGYLGSNFSISSPNPIELDVNPLYRGPTKTVLEYPRTFSTALIGGLKLGTWFSREGFPHINYPDWMKYLGFNLDFSYNQFYFLEGIGSRRMTIIPSPGRTHYQHYKFYGNGGIYSLGFMFAGRYGFFPTEKVPFGKLQPYVAAGPAIFITGMGPNLMFQPNGHYELFPTYYGIPRRFSTSYQSTVNLGLETELGVRFMITRFLSIDSSVKYRYVRPSSTYEFSIDGFTHKLTFAPQLNLFSIQAGVAYHF